MNHNKAAVFVFRATVGLVVAMMTFVIVQAPLEAIFFTPEGGVKWTQFVLVLLAGIVFISILLGETGYSRSLFLKTLFLVVLVSLLIASGETGWVSDTFDLSSAMLASKIQGLEVIRISHVKTVLNVPVLMLLIFGFWFFRTALWPAFSR